MATRKQRTAPSAEVLERAARAVYEREENYGDPLKHFDHIAGLWRSFFGWDVTGEQVALAMVLLKLSRLYRTPGHEDSAVDVAGYIEAYSMVVRGRDEQKSRNLRAKGPTGA